VSGEERKIVTIVFVDLVGSTARAEGADPEDVRAALASYHDHVRRELERHGGTVEKFIGDAVMAAFGAPVAHEDDPERAVRAALAIRAWSVDEPRLDVRIAVNTGEALVTLDARPALGEAMVAGDVVNTAARMQAAAPVNGVLVGLTTYRATRQAIAYREATAVRAKGKADLVQAFEALAPARRLDGTRPAGHAATPFVGREHELEVLRSLFERSRRERSAQLVTVAGVPGIGKSRLVAELQRVVDHDPSVAWRHGRCLPYGDGVTFWALGEVVKAEAGILESDSPAELERKLRSAVSGVAADADEARWLEGELSALVGLGAGGRRADHTAATAAWRRFLEAVAQRGPVVVVLEDLHWADDGLLDFVDELVEWLRDVPLLLVATARPELLERRRAWGGGKANSTTLSIQPLGDDETRELIASLLGSSGSGADTDPALLERAGGNPLFTEQFVRMLDERGTIAEMPQSVHGVIAARLDALTRAEKRLLQQAAVLGRTFWLAALAATTGLEAGGTEPLLQALERKDFIRRDGRSRMARDAQYTFTHALLRDIAYSQLPRAARAEKHRQVAEWMDGLGRRDDHAELIAHHCREALRLGRAAGLADDPGLVRLAREALRAAAERALTLGAYPVAAQTFAEAIALHADDDPVRPRLVLGREQALYAVGGARPASVAEALDAFRQAGDEDGVAAAATLAARIAWSAGDRAAVDASLDTALRALAQRPASRAKADAMAILSGFHMLAGRFDASIGVGQDALRIAEGLGLDDVGARVHVAVGCARCCLGDRDGLREIEEGIATARAAAAFDTVVVGYINLSSELHFFGQLADARSAWQRAGELAERYGLVRMMRSVQAESVAWAFIDGRWDEALAITDALLARAADGPAYTDPLILTTRASIALARGDLEAARRACDRAVELAWRSDAQARAQAFSVGAAVALAAGRADEANALASALIELGTVLVPALCGPAPTLADVAWIMRDLDRAGDLRAILDATPIASPWVDAARAILDGELAHAADVITGIGNAAGAAHASLRAAAQLAAGGGDAAAAYRRVAESFYEATGAGAASSRHPTHGATP
jgi:class 3 adenylate cyclase/tetratricopeptide (TPR) repeat protein